MKRLVEATGDVQMYIDALEQSGRCKNDTQECEHDWVRGDEDYFVCRKCGETT